MINSLLRTKVCSNVEMMPQCTLWYPLYDSWIPRLAGRKEYHFVAGQESWRFLGKRITSIVISTADKT